MQSFKGEYGIGAIENHQVYSVGQFLCSVTDLGVIGKLLTTVPGRYAQQDRQVEIGSILYNAVLR